MLDLLEADTRFVFTLDGQTATVDDYLEIRPQADPRIRALVEEGRLAIGPWQILMDEFLVSGESIVRNLERGWRRAEALGGAMTVGYLPDMFGHVAQMPQILRRAGIEHAVVWRGVPAKLDFHAFRWEAPDGSSVRAEFLPDGYGNAAYVLAAPDRLAEEIEALRQASEPFFGDDPLLAMYGTDHTEPLAELVELVERVNTGQDAFRLELTTLADYIRSVPNGRQLALWRGEMRSSARANMLMGVNSARIELKAACARAERGLERYAEPFQALYGVSWPERFLALAWDRVIKNSAHDSICGCSLDPVEDQVLVRYAEAEQIADGLVRQAATQIAGAVPRGAVAVLNPSPHARTDVVVLDVAVPAEWSDVALRSPDGSDLATQELSRSEPLLSTAEMPGSRIPRTFLRVHGRELFGHVLNGFTIDEAENGPRLTFSVGDEPDPPWLDVGRLRREVELAARAAPDETWAVRIVAAPRRVLAAAVPAPALGWSAVRPVPGRHVVADGVEVSKGAMRNGLLDVQVEPAGTLRVRGGGADLAAVAKLVDGGDAGDTYNYAPPAADTLVEAPEGVCVETLAGGPIVGRLSIVRTYAWPRSTDEGSRTKETAPVEVKTEVELRAGEPFLRFRFSFENPCRDHRLRAHIPLAVRAEGSAAEGQFAVVERGLEAEGGAGEVALPTFPARGFVDAGGVAVLLEHVLEYEVLEGRELALTILRATGLISRNTNRFRAEPAGPEIAVPGAQGGGPRSVAFALFPHALSWVEAGVLMQMERYAHPFVTVNGAGEGNELDAVSGLELEGDGVVLSSLRRRGDWLEVRLVCESPKPVTATLRGGFRESREVDLLGRHAGPSQAVQTGLAVDLAPWEIRTLQLKR